MFLRIWGFRKKIQIFDLYTVHKTSTVLVCFVYFETCIFCSEITNRSRAIFEKKAAAEANF